MEDIKDLENEELSVEEEQIEYFDLVRKMFKDKRTTAKAHKYLQHFYKIEEENTDPEFDIDDFYYAISSFVYNGELPNDEMKARNEWKEIFNDLVEARADLIEQSL